MPWGKEQRNKTQKKVGGHFWALWLRTWKDLLFLPIRGYELSAGSEPYTQCEAQDSRPFILSSPICQPVTPLPITDHLHGTLTTVLFLLFYFNQYTYQLSHILLTFGDLLMCLKALDYQNRTCQTSVCLDDRFQCCWPHLDSYSAVTSSVHGAWVHGWNKEYDLKPLIKNKFFRFLLVYPKVGKYCEGQEARGEKASRQVNQQKRCMSSCVGLSN